MEAPPKKKMTTMQAVFMLGVALIFSIIILIFSTFPISAPILTGTIIGAVVTQKTGSSFLGKVAKWASGISVTATEFFSGVGVAAMSAVGEFVADSLEFLAMGLIFPLWYLILGIKQFGGKHAMNRFFISMASFIAGLIPLINILPTVLIGVSLVILSVRKEDAEKAREYEKKTSNQRKIAAARQQQAAMQAFQQQRAIHDSSMALG